MTRDRNTRVSVVVMTRNRRSALLRSLGRLVELPDRPPVVVVDNGSTDGTPAAVEAAFPAVTVVRAGRNLGAAARTVGVRAASTPYVAFADDDSGWEPGALDRAADRFDAAPRLGLLAARVVVRPGDRVDPVSLAMVRSPLPRAADLPGPSVLGFLACGAVVRRAAFLEVGGFSPVVFFLGEETVLAQDLAAAGWGLAYVDDVVAVHEPAAGGERAGRRRLMLRNALLSSWLRRRFPVPLLDTARLAGRVGDPAARGALLDAVRRLPLALAARRPLPAAVEAEVRLLDRAG